MILVIGATGRIGQHVVKQLGERRVSTRVLTRDAKKAAALFGPGTEVAAGDLDRPDTLARAMAGVDKLYLASAVGAQLVEQHRRAIAAARRAGVRHIVRISTEAVDNPLPCKLRDWHRSGERDLEESGIAWTHLRPCNFMHNMLVFQPAIARRSSFAAPFGDGRMALVDVRDIAAVAVAALTVPGHERKSYKVTGSDWLSYHDIARIIGEAIGRTVSYTPITPEEAREQMTRAGRPDWLIGDLLMMYADLAKDKIPPTTDVVKRLTGRDPIRFVQFAREMEDVFSGRIQLSARHDG